MVQLPTEEELQAIKRYIMIPMVLTVLQRDKKVIEVSQLKTKGPYLSLMDSAMKKAHGDIYDTRVFLRSKGIKIYDERRTEKTIDLKYSIRGYQHTASFPWYLIKNSVESKIKGYLEVVDLGLLFKNCKTSSNKCFLEEVLLSFVLNERNTFYSSSEH